MALYRGKGKEDENIMSSTSSKNIDRQKAAAKALVHLGKIAREAENLNHVWQTALRNLSFLLIIYSFTVVYVKRDLVEVMMFHCMSAVFYLLTGLWLGKRWSKLQFLPYSSPSFRSSLFLLFFQTCWFLNHFKENNFTFERETMEEYEVLIGCLPITSFYFLIVLGAIYIMRDTRATMRKGVQAANSLKKNN